MRQTKKFQKCSICVQKASWELSLLRSCVVFFFLHCFLVCISELIRKLLKQRCFAKTKCFREQTDSRSSQFEAKKSEFPKQFVRSIQEKHPKWTERKSGQRHSGTGKKERTENFVDGLLLLFTSGRASRRLFFTCDLLECTNAVADLPKLWEHHFPITYFLWVFILLFLL